MYCWGGARAQRRREAECSGRTAGRSPRPHSAVIRPSVLSVRRSHLLFYAVVVSLPPLPLYRGRGTTTDGARQKKGKTRTTGRAGDASERAVRVVAQRGGACHSAYRAAHQGQLSETKKPHRELSLARRGPCPWGPSMARPPPPAMVLPVGTAAQHSCSWTGSQWGERASLPPSRPAHIPPLGVTRSETTNPGKGDTTAGAPEPWGATGVRPAETSSPGGGD